MMQHVAAAASNVVVDPQDGFCCVISPSTSCCFLSRISTDLGSSIKFFIPSCHRWPQKAFQPSSSSKSFASWTARFLNVTRIKSATTSCKRALSEKIIKM
uniref:(northern house mosquito) hypothetical protein n=1 Tax=Culex pipiens TaxID=7175 RepID=A0A8D8F1M7_CULPI